MCLGLIYNKKKQQQIIDNMETDKNGYVTLFKHVKYRKEKNNIRYFSVFFKEEYNTNLNVDEKISVIDAFKVKFGDVEYFKYSTGYHIYKNKKDAINRTLYKNDEIFLPVKVKKEWIANIGEDQFEGGPVTIITKRFIIPHYTKWDLFKIKCQRIIKYVI